jgi:hypothetical protein
VRFAVRVTEVFASRFEAAYQPRGPRPAVRPARLQRCVEASVAEDEVPCAWSGLEQVLDVVSRGAELQRCGGGCEACRLGRFAAREALVQIGGQLGVTAAGGVRSRAYLTECPLSAVPKRPPILPIPKDPERSRTAHWVLHPHRANTDRRPNQRALVSRKKA